MRQKTKDNILDKNKVKKLREAIGLSILAIASKADLTYNMWWRVENFGIDIYASNLEKIAEVLNVTPNDLILHPSKSYIKNIVEISSDPNTSVSEITITAVRTVG